MTDELLRPKRGGFLRSFGCAEFIKAFLMGLGPYNSKKISPSIGAPQADIYFEYKSALIQTFALDKAIRREGGLAKKWNRPIDSEFCSGSKTYLLKRLRGDLEVGLPREQGVRQERGYCL